MYLKHLPCCSTHPPQTASLLPNHQPSLHSRAIPLSQTYPYIFPSNVNLYPREIYALHTSRLRNLTPPLRSQLHASPSIHPPNRPRRGSPGMRTLDVDTTDPTPIPRPHGPTALRGSPPSRTRNHSFLTTDPYPPPIAARQILENFYLCTSLFLRRRLAAPPPRIPRVAHRQWGDRGKGFGRGVG